MLDDYRECAQVCEAVNYADKTSVERCNEAVSKMYLIVEEANRKGQNAIIELATLLDEPGPAKWLAHQLVERAKITHEIRNKCFSIVEKLANGNDANAFGEQIWLKEHRDRENP